MRRALAWTAVCLLLVAAGWLAARQLRLPDRPRYSLPAPSAAQRRRMPAAPARGSVDPNHASLEELQELSGVGPAIAQEIIRERETNGPFHYPEDLLCVPGIGPATLQGMRDQLFLPTANEEVPSCTSDGSSAF